MVAFLSFCTRIIASSWRGHVDYSTLGFWLMLISRFECDFVSAILIRSAKYSSQVRYTLALRRRILVKLSVPSSRNFFQNLKSSFWSHLTHKGSQKGSKHYASTNYMTHGHDFGDFGPKKHQQSLLTRFLLKCNIDR